MLAEPSKIKMTLAFFDWAKAGFGKIIAPVKMILHTIKINVALKKKRITTDSHHHTSEFI